MAPFFRAIWHNACNHIDRPPGCLTRLGRAFSVKLALTQQSCHQGQSSGTHCSICTYAINISLLDALMILSIISHFGLPLRNRLGFVPISGRE